MAAGSSALVAANSLPLHGPPRSCSSVSAAPEPAPADRHVEPGLGKTPRQAESGRPARWEWPRILPARPRPGSGSDFRRPMPGSIRMATAPALNSPNTSEMKSIPGRTSRASRVPGATPSCAQPAGDPVAVFVQFAEGQVPVHAACPGRRSPAARPRRRRRAGPAAISGKPPGNVQQSVHSRSWRSDGHCKRWAVLGNGPIRAARQTFADGSLRLSGRYGTYWTEALLGFPSVWPPTHSRWRWPPGWSSTP